jgi:hypothetical protein
MLGVFFVLFGGIFVFFYGKNRGAIFVFFWGGGGVCIYWGQKSGVNFVFFGDIFVFF